METAKSHMIRPTTLFYSRTLEQTSVKERQVSSLMRIITMRSLGPWSLGGIGAEFLGVEGI